MSDPDYTIKAKCPKCEGTGKQLAGSGKWFTDKPCKFCGGTGRMIPEKIPKPGSSSQ
jgi:DnaJ-class molecular chaperone